MLVIEVLVRGSALLERARSLMVAKNNLVGVAWGQDVRKRDLLVVRVGTVQQASVAADDGGRSLRATHSSQVAVLLRRGLLF